MSEIIFVGRETVRSEARVAITPEVVTKYKSLGYSVLIEKGAGIASLIQDTDYLSAGAEIADNAEAAKEADIVLKVRRPSKQEAKNYKKGVVVFAIFDPSGAEEEIAALAKTGMTAFSMDLMPRITRAQSMDVLSSQANLAGYQAVIEAAAIYDRAIPMMMTAAGTVPAAKIFVMGVGVAGLQAIATARRLGAVVTATDVRPAAKEQVISLGAKFITVEDEESRQAETSGGYAREMSQIYMEKQTALIANHITKQDIVITTALVPGRPAPRLVTKQMLETMRPGSVVVDLAIERGGNVESVLADTVVVVGEGVRVVGYTNMASRLAATASQLYARNLYAFLEAGTDRQKGEFSVNIEDELVKETLLVQKGVLTDLLPVTEQKS